ncbi:MAG: MOSC domain-containing protein, partial [Muricauda sp.]|nr:MOSC domain-containing protein [Allomuricauda sp.]
IAQFYELLFAKEKNQHVLQQALHNEALPLAKREKLQKWA